MHDDKKDDPTRFVVIDGRDPTLWELRETIKRLRQATQNNLPPAVESLANRVEEQVLEKGRSKTP